MFIRTILLLNFFIIVISSCEVVELESIFDQKLVNDIENIEINQISNRQIELKFNSKIIETYSIVLLNSLINDVFTNVERYNLTKLENDLSNEIRLAKIEFVSRNNYRITTIDSLEEGIYKLNIHDFNRDNPIIEKEVMFENSENIIEDESIGNYYNYKPVTKKYNDLIFSIIDAEIGSPSFYIIKLSISQLLFNFKDKIKEYLANTNNYKFNILGELDAIQIREVLITGFNPEDQISYNTLPIRDYYLETIDGQEYQSIEILVYLNNLPKEEYSYQASINLNEIGNNEYISNGFKFRQSFTKSKLILYTGTDVDVICYKTEITKKIKCTGKNNRLNSGHDVGIYNYSHPYQLSFLDIDNDNDIKNIVFNYNATCILKEPNINNNIKCWGNNSYGMLGISSNKTDNGEYYYGEQNKNILFVKPEMASLITSPDSITKNKYKTIHSGLFNLCAINMEDISYCWGETTHYTNKIADFTTPSRIDYHHIDSSKVYNLNNITKFTLGNSPRYCFLADGVSSSGEVLENSLYCDKDYGYDSGRTKLNLLADETVEKISIGSKSVCILKKKNGEYFANNVNCFGDNLYSELGTESKGKSTYLIKIDLGGALARDLISGSGVNCIITIEDKLKCIGKIHNERFIIDSTKGKRLYSEAEYFNFGNGVKVETATLGLFSICATLKILVNDEEMYAPKCWGSIENIAMLYYKLTGTEENNLIQHQYHPVVRW